MTAPRLARIAVLLLAGCWLSLPSHPAGAAPRASVTMVLIGDDGVRMPGIDVSDVSVAVSRTTAADKPDDTQDQVSLSLDTSVLSNDGMMTWIGKGSGGGSVEVTAKSGQQTTLYLLSGITTCALNIVHSVNNGMDGQVSLSIGGKHLVVNGTTLN